jgi:hypothetical protein
MLSVTSFYGDTRGMLPFLTWCHVRSFALDRTVVFHPSTSRHVEGGGTGVPDLAEASAADQTSTVRTRRLRLSYRVRLNDTGEIVWKDVTPGPDQSTVTGYSEIVHRDRRRGWRTHSPKISIAQLSNFAPFATWFDVTPLPGPIVVAVDGTLIPGRPDLTESVLTPRRGTPVQLAMDVLDDRTEALTDACGPLAAMGLACELGRGLGQETQWLIKGLATVEVLLIDAGVNATSVLQKWEQSPDRNRRVAARHLRSRYHPDYGWVKSTPYYP